MNEEFAKEILDAIFSSLEELETQNSAVLQLLKDKGLMREDELVAHLEQAGNASNVKWRAARVRIDHLISSAIKAEEREAAKESKKEANKKSAEATDNRQEFPPRPDAETAQPKKGADKQVPVRQGAKDDQDRPQGDPRPISKPEAAGAGTQKSQNQPAEQTGSKSDASTEKIQTQSSVTSENKNEKAGGGAARSAA